MPLILDGTKGETFPSWTTATRPATPNTGQTGYNTTLATLETYNGSAWTPILNTRSAGSIIQVVSATTSTQVSGTSATYVDTTLTATITPSVSTNKILVLVNQQLTITKTSSTAAYCGLQLLRGSTPIFIPATDLTGPYEFGVTCGGVSSAQLFGRYLINYLDSPATTSATTYKTQVKGYNNTFTYVVNANDTVNATSTIVLMEVVA